MSLVLICAGCTSALRPAPPEPTVPAEPAVSRPAAPSVPDAPRAPTSEPETPPTSPAAKPAPQPPPAKPATAAEPSKTPSAPPAKPAEAEPPLDLAELEKRLKETKAIGVFTKLTLKNQVDDLIDQFRAYYQGRRQTSLAELRQPFNNLMLKVLALLQDGDPQLARDLVASREAIWGVLADPKKFATL